MYKELIKDAFLGVAVGDALGVPVEFKSRESLALNPVTDMTGYGTHNQKPGTWSDDSSLTFCLAESLAQGSYDLNDLSVRFVDWLRKGYWGANYEVFDIGNATATAIVNLENGFSPYESGLDGENSNGNGSLMRILPLVFTLIEKKPEERFKIIKEYSSVTHAHIRSVIACFIYSEYALLLIKGVEKQVAYKKMQLEVSNFLAANFINSREISLFNRILQNDISKYPQNTVKSSGYVLHTLEAAFWCVLNNDNFKNTVLAAVNLGDDSDTTGAVAGGLAGIIYGQKNMPPFWVEKLARKDDIEKLAERMAATLDKFGV